ncbi:hypothetical protein [Streptomyces sp. ALI-76-A]|uniref:hypothetical protein n=1 Tax=Streptomyces sp. ALI-76-A TaxID=3025736 RepID=UPI00256F349F|nr:hypothetical protein [Streptomyces sp. ALI-76-A]MDL5205298.1 hypothetical protein [Streptomyces sp. ALI-76-A]
MQPNPADDATDSSAVLPRQRAALRSVPTSGKPDSKGPEDPLRLGRKMRLRLLAAVQALLANPSIAGLKDAPKLAAVVLYAKSRAPKGEKNDLQTSIWGSELGRWMGMKESTVHHKVLPVLRGSGALRTRVVTDAKGHPTGLDCLVMPLWNAHHGGGAGHPLALTKAELATLLRLIEVLFGHGWTPEGKEPTPPGLLASRTGKGAATDRLGLLLMVLNTRASGWLQLCGGSVRKKEGRGAATLARLLGCSPSGARKVLARLVEAGVVARQRKSTATRMNGRGKVMLLPVARAYGRTLAFVETVEGPDPVFSARPDGACGDHAPAGAAGTLGTTGICGAEGPENAVDQERPDGAELHADHASVVTPVGPLQLSYGFSGEGREGEGRRPERVCVREDQAADGGDAVDESAPPVAEDGPLRGEKPKESPVDERDGRRAAGAVAGGRPKAVRWDKAQQQRRVGLPDDLGLRVALGPISGLWERLSGWQQDQVEAAAKAELKLLTGILEQPETAARLLADRLKDRLAETGGEALVDRPYPWLIRRGLVQRQACSDCRCDEGIRLDTGGECENCNNVLHIRLARRAKIAAQVDRELPGLANGERRRVLEERLREHTVLEAERTRRRHARAVVEVEGRRAAAERRRAWEEKVERARRSAPCSGCGLPDAAGLCPLCSYARRTDLLVREAVDLAVAVRADLDDAEQVAQLTARCEADTRTLIADVCRRRGGDEVWAAYAAQEVAERVRDERRVAAERRLMASEDAVAEADAAYEAALRQRPHEHQGAQAAADAACRRTAGYLLRSRLGQLTVLRARVAAGRSHRGVA